MSSESNHDLHPFPKRRGARCTPASTVVAVGRIASQLRLCRAPFLRSSTVAFSVVVPSLGAQLRSSSHRRGRVASSFEACRCSVVRTQIAGSLQARRCRSAGLPNKSLVPTPVTNAPLLSSSRGAAQLRRWASQSCMSSESSHRLHQFARHWGAHCTPASAVVAVCRIASQLRSYCAPALRSSAVASSVAAPSLGAQFRSSSRRDDRAASAFTGPRRSVVRSEGSAASRTRPCRSAGLPNKSLVPTPVTSAPSLSSSRGAAHLRRWATVQQSIQQTDEVND
jgi:hypothetical protein